MKKQSIRTGGVIILLSIALLSGNAYSQTCGITSAIHVFGGSATVSYEADSSSLLPGWHIYEYRWDVNNNPTPVYGPATQDIMAMGYNHLCLTMKATNPVTGDSCESQHCNIFFSTGDMPFPEFDVSPNGLTMDFSGTYLSPGFLTSAYYDFGDGNQSTGGSLFDSHTYAAPGDYLVCLVITTSNPPLFNTNANGEVCRKIHVNNGLPNLEIGFVSDNTFCDSVAVSASSGPAYTGGFVTGYLGLSAAALVSGSPSGLIEKDIPGSDYLTIEADDANNGYDIKPHLVFLQDCAIIPDTIYGTVYNDLNYNGIKEAGEPGIPNLVIKATGNISGYMGASTAAQYTVKTDASGNYSILVPHGSTNVSLTSYPGYIRTFPASSNYSVNFNTGTGHPNYNWGLSALTTHICGLTYLDDDQDGLYNATVDRRLPNVNIHVLNTITGLEYNVFSGSTGNYCIDVPPGNFVLKPVYYNLSNPTFTPDSIVVNSPSGGNFTSNMFGFFSAVAGDPQVTLNGNSEARPGFDFSLAARVVNTGFYNSKVDVVMNYDPSLTFLSSLPNTGVVNTTSHTITWTTDSLKPAEATSFHGMFNVPASVPIGTQLLNSVSITPLTGFTDADLTNNFDTYNKTVIGSYDPNEKMVHPEGAGVNGNVSPDTRLYYHINFQNTGTASAINIVVQDTLDENLDMNTLLPGSASHNYTLVTNGRVIVWKFFNINLPDSNTNEPLSHGYIEYSINPIQGLPDGTVINNTASIYFDYNAPIYTNTTLNTLLASTGMPEWSATQQLAVWPVPAGDQLFILPREVQQGSVSMALLDMRGRVVKTVYKGNYVPGSVVQTDISGLPKGVYLLRMVSDGSTVTTRVIKE
ncbi:MAG TPA: T9SS type A sorting domain-containing protein [Bacteroidia bacterium]|nr:T9SS type A sorting domain-containing protein [Bacteroidia bacterium]